MHSDLKYIILIFVIGAALGVALNVLSTPSPFTGQTFSCVPITTGVAK